MALAQDSSLIAYLIAVYLTPATLVFPALTLLMVCTVGPVLWAFLGMVHTVLTLMRLDW